MGQLAGYREPQDSLQQRGGTGKHAPSKGDLSPADNQASLRGWREGKAKRTLCLPVPAPTDPERETIPYDPLTISSGDGEKDGEVDSSTD